MIPEKAITKAFVAIAGEQRLFSMAQNNMTDHLDDLQACGAQAYVAHNGKLDSGFSTNGSDRLYWWPNTEIDGSYLSKFKESPEAEPLDKSITGDSGFQAFKVHIEQGSKNLLSVEPYVDAENAGGNVRLGMRITAESTENFKSGLEALGESERPRMRPDYESMFVPDDPPSRLSFKNMDND